MKRLQFRHHEEVFASRQAALDYFASIVDVNDMSSTQFGESLYAEPMVAKYLDDDNNTQILLAIGVESGHTPYHIIDSADIIENIAANGEAIADEIERATAVEDSLSESIENLREEISGNVATIVSVEPSSANVLEEYALQNSKGDTLGEHIKIYKESSLVEVQLGYEGAFLTIDPSTGDYYKNPDGTYKLFYNDPQPTGDKQYLYLIYRREDETLSLVGVDLQQFITENEYGDGLQKTGAVISVKIDATGEEFLTVSSEGVKISGIETAISAAKEEAKEYADGVVEAEAAAREEGDTILSGNIESAKEECKAQAVSAYTMATAYTEEMVNELSANTEAAIAEAGSDVFEEAVESAKTYTDNLRIANAPLETGSTLVAKYQLEKGDGVPMGVQIEIPRATSLKTIEKGFITDTIDAYGNIVHHQESGITSIDIVYINVDGDYKLTIIPVTDILTESTFGEGLKYNSDTGVVKVEIHDLEQFLHVDDDGLYTSGISEAITDAQNAAQNASSAYTDAQIATLTQHVDDVDAGLESRIADNEEHILELHTSVETLANTVADMATKISGIETLSAATQLNSEHIEALSGAVVNNYATSADTVNAINEVITLVSANTNSIAELAEAVSANTDAINAVSGLAEQNKNAIADLSGAVESHLEEFVALSGEVVSHANAINSINERMDIIDDRIADISGSVIAIQEFLTGSGLTQAIYNFMKDKISGTPTEIQVTPIDSANTITIGFDNDAIFGEVPEE